jgi:hypothetical protein
MVLGHRDERRVWVREEMIEVSAVQRVCEHESGKAESDTRDG